MSAHVLLNLLNGLGKKKDEMRGLLSILSVSPTSLINSVMQGSIYHMTLK